MSTTRPLLFWGLLSVLPVGSSAQEIGPARGSLVVSGGGETTSHIAVRFIELAGGPDAPIVAVTTRGTMNLAPAYNVFATPVRGI